MILYHKHNMPDMQVRTLAFIGDAGGGISDEKNKIFFVPYLTLAEPHHGRSSDKYITLWESNCILQVENLESMEIGERHYQFR